MVWYGMAWDLRPLASSEERSHFSFIMKTPVLHSTRYNLFVGTHFRVVLRSGLAPAISLRTRRFVLPRGCPEGVSRLPGVSTGPRRRGGAKTKTCSKRCDRGTKAVMPELVTPEGGRLRGPRTNSRESRNTLWTPPGQKKASCSQWSDLTLEPPLHSHCLKTRHPSDTGPAYIEHSPLDCRPRRPVPHIGA
jgi:hypothetical protein